MSRTPTTNVKAIMLSTTDNIINEISAKLAKLYAQDEPYSPDEENELESLHDNMFYYQRFRKAFAAETNYDFKVLQQVVQRIIKEQA